MTGALNPTPKPEVWAGIQTSDSTLPWEVGQVGVSGAGGPDGHRQRQKCCLGEARP